MSGTGWRSSVSITSAAVSTALGKLIERGTDLYPVMLQVAGILLDNLQESFETATAGNIGRAPFAPLNPAYRKRRFAAGFTGPILTRKGILRNSFETRATHREAIVGTALRIAGYHHFGTSRLPARPMLGLDQPHRNEVLRMVNAYLSESFPKG